jgi:hypothetical protein
MIKIVTRFAFSVLIAALLTSFASTQIILLEIESFGISVSFMDRFIATITDFVGLGITLVILITPSFLFGFIIAKYAHQLIGGNRKFWYLAAGFSSFPLTLYLLQYFMGVTILAAARTAWGMLIVGFCCMIAGWIFAKLTSGSNSEGNSNEK